MTCRPALPLPPVKTMRRPLGAVELDIVEVYLIDVVTEREEMDVGRIEASKPVRLENFTQLREISSMMRSGKS